MPENTSFIILVVGLCAILLFNLLARALLARYVPAFLARHSPLWADILEKRRVLTYLTLSVPGLLISGFVQLVPGLDPDIASFIQRMAYIYSVIMLALAAESGLLAYYDYYVQHYDFARQAPIRAVIQVVSVIILVVAGLALLAIILNVPMVALAGLVAAIGALTAFMFREPLLGLAASLQLSMNNMLALGDWIEMPSHGVDGEVTEINVTSAKVRNWDNSIVNVPTYALIQNSFRNWKKMQAGHARRVKRPLYLDQSTLTFADAAEKEDWIARIVELYEDLPAAAQQNPGLQGVSPAELEARQALTNVERFMAYATQVIAGHEATRSDYDCYVRQLDPTPQGLPVELYFYTRDDGFVPYYAVQREIMSHLLAMLPVFGLRPFQIYAAAPNQETAVA